jgi:hypothetical protein
MESNSPLSKSCCNSSVLAATAQYLRQQLSTCGNSSVLAATAQYLRQQLSTCGNSSVFAAELLVFAAATVLLPHSQYNTCVATVQYQYFLHWVNICYICWIRLELSATSISIRIDRSGIFCLGVGICCRNAVVGTKSQVLMEKVCKI